MSEGRKFDSEKTDMSLLSATALLKIAEVMTRGKTKYGANNWRGGLAYTRLIAAVLRHIFAWLGGESLDPETGLSHLAHASCGLMMLLEFETTRPELDDRYVASSVASKKKTDDQMAADVLQAFAPFAPFPASAKSSIPIDNELGPNVKKYVPKEQS